MDFPIIIIWTSPLSILGKSGVFFISISLFIGNSEDPDETPRSKTYVVNLRVLIRIGEVTHNVCFYGELTKIILELPSNTLVICSTV